MVPPVRHNFTAAVRSRLAASSGHGCCKPDCRAVTFCARDNGSIYPIGQAGHITGAAPGGPRYDANMTADERESDEKGLWLCGNCHKMVDSDHNSFSVDCLRQWKSDASKNTREALGRPNTDAAVSHIVIAHKLYDVQKLRAGLTWKTPLISLGKLH